MDLGVALPTYAPDASPDAILRIAQSEFNPKPPRAEGIPILLGGFSPRAIERAARIADGYNPIASSYDVLRRSVDLFRSSAAATGRDPASLSIIVRANVPITSAPMGDQRPFLGGSPDEIAGDWKRVQDLGVEEVFFRNQASIPLEDQVSLLERLRREV